MLAPDSAPASGESLAPDRRLNAPGNPLRPPARSAAPLVLSAQPADARSRTGVKVAVVLSVILFVMLAPFAQVQLDPFPVFVPVYQTVLIVIDLVTATLLIFQLRVTRSRALLLLACGYVFTALMTLVHLLTFPGVFAPAGLLGGGPQTTAYLFVFWHTGFPLAVIGYALSKRRAPAPAAAELPVARAMVLVLLAVAALSILAIAGNDLFPPLLAGDKYSSSFNIGRYGQWVITAVAILVVLRSKPHSVLDHWLLVVLCTWFIEIALVAIFNAGRYDLGFYAGRVYGLLASTFMLAVLLWEQSRVYSGLGEAAETARSEAELRENRAVLRLALEGGRMGAWSGDAAGGQVVVRAERDGSVARISVRDTGIGIGPEHLGGIFDIFSQVTPALERSQGGLGIGLALVRGFVQLHGGSVEAHSAGIGHGTEFIVRLPLLAPAAQPAPTTTAREGLAPS